MAESNDKQGKKKLDISFRSVEDNIVFSERDQVAFYKLPNIGWDFLSNGAKYTVGQQINNALNNLMGERQAPIECALTVTSVPYDLDMWDEQVRVESEGWGRAPGYEAFMREQHAFLAQQHYARKVVYLAIKLGPRGSVDIGSTNIFEAGFRGAVDIGKKMLNQYLGTVNDIVDDKESQLAHRREESYYQILSSGNLAAQRTTTEDILLLLKRQFYPAMPTPYLDVDPGNRVDFNDIEYELASSVDNFSRFVRITQLIDGYEWVGYRAAMSITKLPARTAYPDTMPFLYFLNRLGHPYTSYARFTMLPNAKMAKEVEKRRKEQRDEWDNIKKAAAKGSEIDTAPVGFTDAYNDLQVMERLVQENKTPWVEGHYRIVVEATTERELKERCVELRQNYADIEVKLSLTAGDQTQLFLEQMPGDHLRMKSFKQLTNLEMLGTSGFNFSPEVGDIVKGNH